MAISYNTGTTAHLTAGGSSSTFTIPAGVLNGDTILVLVMCFTTATGSPSLSLTSTATTPVPQGSLENTGINGGIQVLSRIFSIAATGSDAGATLTYSASGGSGGAYWFNVGLASYSGAGSVDVIQGTASFSASGSGAATTPSATTVQSGDWQVQFLGVAPPGSPAYTVPSGLTQRQAITSATNAGLLLEIADSNAPVGAGGTAIGNTSWTVTGSTTGNTWITSFTVGLSPPIAGPPPPENPTMPRIPHPLWHRLLEVATSRFDWQAQGVASTVATTWRLMDGLHGRPGTGSTGTQTPASATANSGNLVNGTSFYVTQAGLFFTGYWWYVAASGGQSTAATKFALWSCNANGGGTGGAVIPASVVTSGALSAGWNFVPLPQPVPLAVYGIYQAAVGLNGGPYPVTGGQTAGGDPYSAGWANGPLVQPSESSGSNQVAVVGAGASTTSGSDPSLVMPGGDAGAGNIYWLDVQVTNVPTGYTGSYRLWPNMNDSDYLTVGDAAVNYVLATEFTLTQACKVNAIWYYVPGGQGATGNQWATSADIWNVHTQAKVATQASPTWINPNTGTTDVNSNSGRWVYTKMAATVTLAPGDYKVSVYNGNATPNAWSAKRLGYWQAWNQRADGTYLHNPPGAAGITNGPLAAPTTPAASVATDFNNGTIIEPGQSTFASGPPNQYPNVYVGTPSNLFQNYWIDIEVSPLPKAVRTVTATITASASKPKAAGTTPTFTAARTATAHPSRVRTSTRAITATVTATAGVTRHRSAARTITATVTAAGGHSGAIHSAGTTPTFTATRAATGTAVRHRISSRAETATVTAAAGVTRHRSESRPVTVTITAHAVIPGGGRTASLPVTAGVTARTAHTTGRGGHATVTAVITGSATKKSAVPPPLFSGTEATAELTAGDQRTGGPE